MESENYRASGQNDPAAAFIDLRFEVSLLRRAVEGLTAERQSTPDYSPTLTELSSRLARIDGWARKVADSPAMLLTPENLAGSIVKASEAARAGDRETLTKADAVLRTSVSSINAVVAQAWAADRQWKQLSWTGGISFLVGALSVTIMLHLVS